MQKKLDAEDVLELWELTWGPLEGKWRTQFLNHPDMCAILEYSFFQIDIAIRRSKKLSLLLPILKTIPSSKLVSQSQKPRRLKQKKSLAVEVEQKNKYCISCGLNIGATGGACRCS